MKEIADTKVQGAHTARVGELLYDIYALSAYAKTLHIEAIPLESFTDAVSEGHTYWLDTEGNMFGPSALLKDWEAAQNNPLWAEHIESIKRANLDDSIWLAPGSLVVFDGMHRLTKAFIDGAKEIKVRKFKELPSSAVIQE